MRLLTWNQQISINRFVEFVKHFRCYHFNTQKNRQQFVRLNTRLTCICAVSNLTVYCEMIGKQIQIQHKFCCHMEFKEKTKNSIRLMMFYILLIFQLHQDAASTATRKIHCSHRFGEGQQHRAGYWHIEPHFTSRGHFGSISSHAIL